MRRAAILLCVLAAITAGAGLLRSPQLDNRPMHADEAVNAVRFGQWLERGRLAYDPAEFHGPALAYLTLPAARASGARRLADLDEVTLRFLPAVLGVALVAGLWLLRGGLGLPATVAAAVLTAISPAMVFYSRYYIHEIPLVFFTFLFLASGWRCLQTCYAGEPPARRPGRLFWAALAGLAAGAAHATKETFSLALLAAIGSAGLVALWSRRGPGRAPGLRKGPLLLACLTALVVAAAVSGAFFSSFGANPRGLGDSFTAYANYFHRAAGAGQAAWHVHPWYYYLQVLFWSPGPGGATWSEGLIAALALVGMLAALTGRGAGGMRLPLLRFLTLYTIILAVVYCLIPYKTPWSMLSFLHGLILLAGVGAGALVNQVRSRALKAAVAGALCLAAIPLGVQAWQGAFLFPSAPGNPYAYAQTTADVPVLARHVEGLAASLPPGDRLLVQVIRPGRDYWPLPWYLRRLGRVGWYDAVGSWPAAGGLQPRPGVPRSVFIRQDVWDAWAPGDPETLPRGTRP
ncbi:MAG: TIGR03663 family protein [Planctomycetota bacterium]|nr:TIGR03663 family protein [Planctomycetota bacterium]